MSKVGKVLAAILLTPIALVVLGIGGCEARKAYYDSQVKQMCERDGGASIYERMAISPEMFNILKGHLGGGLVIPHESRPEAGIPIVHRVDEAKIRDGYPSITRSEIQIIRRSDGKILGRQVQYGRSGGDFPFTTSAPSYFVCPILKTPLTRQILLVEGSIK